jgi:hypothetical protein
MGQEAANIVYECRRCRYYSARELNECPNCGKPKTFRAVQRFISDTPHAQAPANVYICQNCRYQSPEMLLACPGCGNLRTLAAVPVVGYDASLYGGVGQYGVERVVYGCRNLICPHRSEQWTQVCPRCGKGIRTEAELNKLSMICGMLFIGMGALVLVIGFVVAVLVFSQDEVKGQAYGAVALLFGIGAVLAIGGLSGIKGHWWLIHLLMGFRD